MNLNISYFLYDARQGTICGRIFWTNVEYKIKFTRLFNKNEYLVKRTFVVKTKFFT